jgi:hypothetical protein
MISDFSFRVVRQLPVPDDDVSGTLGHMYMFQNIGIVALAPWISLSVVNTASNWGDHTHRDEFTKIFNANVVDKVREYLKEANGDTAGLNAVVSNIKLLIPICYNKHWNLLLADYKNRNLTLYESLDRARN